MGAPIRREQPPVPGPGTEPSMLDSIVRHPCRLGVGTATFGREIDASASFAVLDAAFGRGIDSIDTAERYSSGAAEAIVGAWLASRKVSSDAVEVATKVYPPFSADGIARDVESSLRRLGVDSIALLYLHTWDGTALANGTVAALDGLARAGKVRRLGVSNFNREQLAALLRLQDAAGAARVVSLQNNHNVAVRGADVAMREFCASNRVQVVTYSPRGAGFLSGKHRRGVVAGSRFDVAPAHRHVYFTDEGWRRLARLECASKRLGVAAPDLALAWACHQRGVARVIVGARTPEHIDDALRARAIFDRAAFEELERA